MNRNAFPDDEAGLRRYFAQMARCKELDTSPLPSPELIWWRSRLSENRRLARQSVAAIEAVRVAALAAAAAFVVLSFILWAPRLFADLPLPLSLTVASLALFGCSTGGVLLAWSRHP